MTREQAKREIDSLDYYLQNHTDDYGEESHTAMMMAIKALEQEPCEDVISRQIISDYVQSHIQEINTGYGDLNKHTNEILRMIVDYIENMPPVTPQEPFINKPCVAHQVCHEDKVKILDKIRAEIADLDDADYDYEGYYKAVTDAVKIIDKYKAESEDKE